jgi:hypothetical protein
MRAFYDLRPDQATTPDVVARHQRDDSVDRDRRAIERAHHRNDASALARALTRYHHHDQETP